MESDGFDLHSNSHTCDNLVILCFIISHNISTNNNNTCTINSTINYIIIRDTADDNR